MPIITVTIKSSGKVLSQEHSLLSLEINREVNRIPSAELVLMDGDAAQQEFALSDEVFFEPGKEIEILLNYEDGQEKASTVFKGLVVGHNLEVNAHQSTLTVRAQDEAVKMTKGRKSMVFQEKADSDIFKTLISDNGLKAGKVDKTKAKHEEIVQHYCTDWDFLLTRAEANNLLVVAEDGEISATELKISGSAKHVFEYGISEIIGFEMEADAGQQFESIESVSWDIKAQKLTKKTKAAEFALSQSNLKGKSVAGELGGKEYLLKSVVALDPAEMKPWADGAMARTRMSFLRGVMSVPGFAKINLLDIMELLSIGKRFNGTTLVTGIRHTVKDGEWQTDVQFGLSGKSFSKSPNILDSPATGLLPAIQGLQIGIVDAFEEDGGKEFRVRVILPCIDPAKGKVWARLASPEAGKERGYFFRPEKGDEVVVGFFNNDPRHAVILGALFSSKNVPPKGWEKLDDKNALKGIMTKSGITIEFNDDDQTLKFLTSEKQSILMDEKNKSIEIIDLNKNTITLNDKGIEIKVADKLAIEAKGDIEIKGKNIKLDASANVEIKGSKVDVK